MLNVYFVYLANTNKKRGCCGKNVQDVTLYIYRIYIDGIISLLVPTTASMVINKKKREPIIYSIHTFMYNMFPSAAFVYKNEF